MSKLAVLITTGVFSLGALTLYIVDYTKMKKDRLVIKETLHKAQIEIDKFNHKKKSILSEINSALANKKTNKALEITSRYIEITNDQDIKKIHEKTILIYKTEKQLEFLSATHSDDVFKLFSIYKRLSKLNPENIGYKQKYDFYDKKYSELTKKYNLKVSDCIARATIQYVNDPIYNTHTNSMVDVALKYISSSCEKNPEFNDT